MLSQEPVPPVDDVQAVADQLSIDLVGFASSNPVHLHEEGFRHLFAGDGAKLVVQVDASPSAERTLRTGWCALYAPTEYGYAKFAWPWAEIPPGIFCRADISRFVSNIHILKDNDLQLSESGYSIFFGEFLARSDWTTRLSAHLSSPTLRAFA